MGDLALGKRDDRRSLSTARRMGTDPKARHSGTMVFFSGRNDMTTHSGTGDDAGVYRTLLESTQAIP
jgi:hypothetical protein